MLLLGKQTNPNEDNQHAIIPVIILILLAKFYNNSADAFPSLPSSYRKKTKPNPPSLLLSWTA